MGLTKKDYDLLLQEYYQKYGDINVPQNYKVEYKGEMIPLGQYVADKRKAYRKFHGENCKTTSVITEEEIRVFESMGIDWYLRGGIIYLWDFGDGERLYHVSEIANHIGVPKRLFYSYLSRFQFDVTKAIRFCLLIKRGRPKIESRYSQDFVDSNFALIEKFLLTLGLDRDCFLDAMKDDGISFEEAIASIIFQKKCEYRWPHLKILYFDSVSTYQKLSSNDEFNKDTISEYMKDYLGHLKLDYHLSEEEFQKLSSIFYEYIHTIKKYQVFEVGFTIGWKEKLEKTCSYSFDSDEIEESFFVYLPFTDDILFRNYKRRILLKNLTVSWNDNSDQEVSEKIQNYHLTPGEVLWISSKRREIDSFKRVVDNQSEYQKQIV